MDRLSQELVDHIVSYVDRFEDPPMFDPFGLHRETRSALPPLATINRRWQNAIERYTFSELTVSSHDLDTLRATCVGPRRRWLRWLRYRPLLPSYDEAACGRFERMWERHANDVAFSDTIHRLFGLLAEWEAEGADTLSFGLGLDDIYTPNETSLASRRLEAALGKRYDILSARYLYSRVRLLDPERLPVIRSVHSFVRNAPANRYLDLPTCAQIACHLPNLTCLRWGLNDNDRIYEGRRRKSREVLASIMDRLDLPLLKEADLRFWHEPPTNQNYRLPDLVAPSPSDHLSSSVCHFSRSLTKLTLTGVIDASALTPPPLAADEAFWPNLVCLEIRFDIVAPSGSWYFKGDLPSLKEMEPVTTDPDTPEVEPTDGPLALTGDGPDAYSEDEEMRLLGYFPCDVFRTIPDDQVMRPLIMAFATAARDHMPKLEEATISTVVDVPCGREAWGLSWLAPDREAPWLPPVALEDDAHRRRLALHVGGWRPDPILRTALCRIGKERFSDPTYEEYLLPDPTMIFPPLAQHP